MSAFDIRVCEWLNDASISHAKKQTILNRMSVGISNYRTLELDVSHNPPTHTKRSSCYQRVASESMRSPSRTSKRATSTRSDGVSVARSVRASSKARTATTTATTMHTRPTNASSNANFLAQQPIDVDYALQQRISKALRRIQEGDEGTPDCLLFPYRQQASSEEESISITVRPAANTTNYQSSLKSTNTTGGKRSEPIPVMRVAAAPESSVGDSEEANIYGKGFATPVGGTETVSNASQGVDCDKVNEGEEY
eukprot:Tbor_TRINITY_DN4938_c0_g2::TRINITY_DN4938_c0_g2_i1::g.9903::m.9903